MSKSRTSQKKLQKQYDGFLNAAKVFDLDGDIKKAKEQYEEALKIAPKFKKSSQNEKNISKLKKKLQKLNEKIIAGAIEETTSTFGQISQGTDGPHSRCHVTPQLYANLYDHQRVGVAWLWKLYSKCSGGILADDMGLGKTLQVITFVSGLLRQRPQRRILIVAPASLLPHWKSEIKRWDPSISIAVFSNAAKKKRNQDLANIIRHGGIVLTNYEKIWHSERSSNIDLFTGSSETACEEIGWKVGKVLQWATVVLDEGHRIKNHNTGIYHALSAIKSRMRLVLSGTPFQNNLNELWTLFTYISDGKMFPSLTSFRKHIAVPIERGEKLDSSAYERRDAKYKRQQLHLKIKDFILRREKGKAIAVSHKETARKVRKHDVVAWIPMSIQQQDMYREVLKSNRVQTILEALENEDKTDGGNVLLAMNDLKQVCDGTKLMTADDKPLDETSSCKLNFLKSLLQHFRKNQHRTLIFSKYTRVLNAIELMCVRYEFKCARIDGDVKHAERQTIVDKFNHDGKFDCMLLTTGVGAVGLTLTGADRVVIFGPDWNPAIDNQAVDRAFRIGQQQDVLCYRLMTCNTIEEKMYRRQVFKEGVVRSVMQDKAMNVYSSGQDLVDVFALNDPGVSDMQEYLAEKQQDLRDNFKRQHEDLYKELETVETFLCYGMSHHDVLFDEEREDDEMENMLVPPTPQQMEREILAASLGLNNGSENVDTFSKKKKKKDVAKRGKENKTSKYKVDKFGLFDEEAEDVGDYASSESSAEELNYEGDGNENVVQKNYNHIKHGFYKSNRYKKLPKPSQEKFKKLLEAGKTHELSGDKLFALDCYIDCLNIADDSYELHRDVLRLAEENGMLEKLA